MNKLIKKFSLVLLAGIGVGLVVFVLLNLPMLIKRYWPRPSGAENLWVENAVTSKNEFQVISPELVTKLIIPSLDLHGDVIVPPVEIEDGKNVWVENNLDNGIVAYPNGISDVLRENLVLFGHSSAIHWNAPYATIFATLDRVVEGDQVVLELKDGRQIEYRIASAPEKIKNDRIDIVKKNPAAGGTLTLVTCWPPGTTYERLMVTATRL